MIRVREVHVEKNGRPVLRGVDLEAGKGELHAILGPNGAGKTTLLRVIAGLEKPAKGYVEVYGARLPGVKPRTLARLVGYVPQVPKPAGLTVLEYVVMQRLLARGAFRPQREDIEEAERILEELGISELADRRLDALSGGQRMLAEIARALSHNPPALLLDEPVSPLDPRNQHHVLELLKGLARKAGKTVIVVLHDLNHALNYADRATLLANGRVVASGPPERILDEDTLWRVYGVKTRLLEYNGYRFLAIIPARQRNT